MDHTQDDINSLAEKLAEIDLTSGEEAALAALVDVATGEVSGFSQTFDLAPLRPGGSGYMKIDGPGIPAGVIARAPESDDYMKIDGPGIPGE